MAGAQPVTLWATLGNTMGAGVRVEGSINETDLPAEADFCNVAGPYVLTVDTGQPTPPIYGQLGEAGVSQTPGPPPGWIAQVGYGPTNSNPINLSGWRFVDATYEAQHFYADSFEASLSRRRRASTGTSIVSATMAAPCGRIATRADPDRTPDAPSRRSTWA